MLKSSTNGNAFRIKSEMKFLSLSEMRCRPDCIKCELYDFIFLSLKLSSPIVPIAPAVGWRNGVDGTWSPAPVETEIKLILHPCL